MRSAGRVGLRRWPTGVGEAAGVPSRFYFPSTTPAPITPPTNATWLGAPTDRGLLGVKATDLGALEQIVIGAAGFNIGRRYVSAPLATQTISGSVKAQLQAEQDNNFATVDSAIEIYVVMPGGDGWTVRGTLLAQNSYNTTNHIVFRTVTNNMWAPSTALSSLSVQAGDRLVVCIGASPDMSVNVTMRYTNAAGVADLPEDNTTTTDLVPWIEFSNAIYMQ